MPKAILEFDIPQDQYMFRHSSRGPDYYALLEEIDQSLRNAIKFAPEEAADAELHGLQRARDIITQLCDEYNVRLYDE